MTHGPDFDTRDREGYDARDYYTDIDNATGETINDTPMRCADCDRPAYYDNTDDMYHHAINASVGCFLIPADDNVDDHDHPLLDTPEKFDIESNTEGA